MSRPTNLGELRASGWRSVLVRDEIRHNVVAKIRAGDPLFHDILGYESSVLPPVSYTHLTLPTIYAV